MSKSKAFKKRVLYLLIGATTLISTVVVATSVSKNSVQNSYTNNYKQQQVQLLKQESGNQLISNTRQMNKDLDAITVEVADTANKTVYDVKHNHSNFVFTNYDQNKYQVKIINLKTNNKYGVLAINVKIIDIKTKEESSERSIILDGFKIETSSKVIIENELEDIEISYPDSQYIHTGLIDATKIQTYNFDTEQFEVAYQKVEKDSVRDDVLLVTTKLKNIKTKEMSKSRTYRLEGFKTKADYDQEKSNLKKDAYKLRVSVKDKRNTEVKDVFKEDIMITGIDLNAYSVEIKYFAKNERKYNIDLKIEVVSKANPTLKETVEVDILGFKNTGISNQQFEEQIKKTKFSYPNRSVTTVENFVQENLKHTGYDTSLVKLVVVGFQKNYNSRTVDIEFHFEDLKTSNRSRTVTAAVTGFKNPREKEEFEEDLKNLKVDVLNKRSVKVEDVKEQDLIFSNYNDNKYTVEVKGIKGDADKKTLEVSVEVFPNSDTDLSLKINFILNGFSGSEITKEEFEEQVSKITFSYHDKEKTSIEDIVEENIMASGYDKDHFTFELLNVDLWENGTSIYVLYLLRDKSDPQNTSGLQSARIDGFKITEHVKEFESELKNIVVNVLEKESKDATEITKDDVVLTGFDSKKIHTYIKKVEIGENGRSIVVTVKITSNQNSNIRTTETYTVDGFNVKDLTEEQFNEQSEKAFINYKNKESTTREEIKDSAFLWSGLNEKIVSLQLLYYVDNSDDNSITVTYLLKDKRTGKKSREYKQVVSGFKKDLK